VPHLIVLVDDVDQVALIDRGPALRFDAALAPEGANINFISKTRPGAGGASGGCGLMNAASRAKPWPAARVRWARAARSRSGAGPAADRYPEPQRPDDRSARYEGPDGRYDDVWLIGEGRMVFRGVIT